MNLQNQIRQSLVDGIINGAFPPGMKLPSSRKLARQLNVARNTVVAAYQLLPALRSMDTDGRVIYVASFSNVLTPGLLFVSTAIQSRDE